MLIMAYLAGAVTLLVIAWKIIILIRTENQRQRKLRELEKKIGER